MGGPSTCDLVEYRFVVPAEGAIGVVAAGQFRRYFGHASGRDKGASTVPNLEFRIIRF
jgi:hypothetical protein